MEKLIFEFVSGIYAKHICITVGPKIMYHLSLFSVRIVEILSTWGLPIYIDINISHVLYIIIFIYLFIYVFFYLLTYYIHIYTSG